MTARTFNRRAYSALEVYSPPAQGFAVDLSDNTNLWGPPPSAVLAVREMSPERMARYPASYSAELAQALAGYVEVPADCVVVGCGSDDIIDSAIRAFAEPGSVVAMCDPTFSMASVFVTLNGARPVRVPFLPRGEIDVDGLLSSNPDIVYLCSPNNPTGSVISVAQITELMSRFNGLVILDEAYAEFAGTSLATRAAGSDNLIVTRTLSKAFGLAGMRVGYSICAPALAVEIAKSRGPYKVTAASEGAALQAVTQDVRWMRACVDETSFNRGRLVLSLKERGYMPIQSFGNFLLIPVPDSRALEEQLGNRGVSVRAFKNLPEIGDAIRVTVGPTRMMDAFLAALDEAAR